MNLSAKKKLIKPRRTGKKILLPPTSSDASGKRSRKATAIKTPAAKLTSWFEKSSVISCFIRRKKLPTSERILPIKVKIMM